MHSRQAYISNDITHQEYYAQYVTPEIIKLVSKNIGRTHLMSSQDPYFNDIALDRWDRIAKSIIWSLTTAEKDLIRSHQESISLSWAVCVAKAAARELIK